MSVFNKLVQGEILSESTFYKFVGFDGDKAVFETALGKVKFNNLYVEKFLHSADQFVNTVKCSRTELIDKYLILNTNVAMTVSYYTKVDEKEVREKIVKLRNQFLDIDSFTKELSKLSLTKGDKRIMKGRHFGHVDEHGRLQFEDLEITTGIPMRLVDPRTVEYVIVKGIKYQVK